MSGDTTCIEAIFERTDKEVADNRQQLPEIFAGETEECLSRNPIMGRGSQALKVLFK